VLNHRTVEQDDRQLKWQSAFLLVPLAFGSIPFKVHSLIVAS